VSQYGSVLIFFLIVLSFSFLALFIALLIRARVRKQSELKLDSYECGEDPKGDAWIRFPVGYYLVALLFILFDVETVFLFPWAVTLRKLGLFAFFEMIVFLLILFLGWLYAFKKGAIEWK